MECAYCQINTSQWVQGCLQYTTQKLLSQLCKWTRCTSYCELCHLVTSSKLSRHRCLVNAKSPEHQVQIFIYRWYHLCTCPPRSYSALGNTRILKQFTKVSLHISTVHWCNWNNKFWVKTTYLVLEWYIYMQFKICGWYFCWQFGYECCHLHDGLWHLHVEYGLDHQHLNLRCIC